MERYRSISKEPRDIDDSINIGQISIIDSNRLLSPQKNIVSLLELKSRVNAKKESEPSSPTKK
jgi:hypothetical protein